MRRMQSILPVLVTALIAASVGIALAHLEVSCETSGYALRSSPPRCGTLTSEAEFVLEPA
jgi:hypothetical protein